MVFDQWLGTVGASSGTQINLFRAWPRAFRPVNKQTAQRWIYNPAADPQGGPANDTKYLSFLTRLVGGIPIKTVDARRGDERRVLRQGGLQRSARRRQSPYMGDIPGKFVAGPPLSAQLKALEVSCFLISSACVSNDSLPPAAPASAGEVTLTSRQRVDPVDELLRSGFVHAMADERRHLVVPCSSAL